MARHARQLIPRDDPAPGPFLFSETEIGRLTKDINPSDAYSAEEIRHKHPEIYQEVVRLLAQGMSKRMIQRTFKLHFYTVCAIQDQQTAQIEAVRLKLGRKALDMAGVLMESLEDDLIQNKLKPEAKSFAIATLVDKGQVLTGGATARLESLEAPSKESYQDWLKSAKQAQATEIEATVTKMGSDGRELAAMSPGLAGSGAVWDSAKSDCVSDVSVSNHTVTVADSTPKHTDFTTDSHHSDPARQGGEGV